MNPAPSIIFFTVLSGIGYGLLFLLGLLGALALLPVNPWFGGASLALALGLITLGLLSSTLHLGHPERAWRALSQWRSSWLSREGVAALVTFVPALLLGVSWIGGTGPSILWAITAALGAVVTVGCTAMIYASLRPVARWHNGFTLPLYLLHGLAGGSLALSFLLSFSGPVAGGIFYLPLATVTAAWALQLLYWSQAETLVSEATAESATGLGGIGEVRLLEAPHSEENYLLREMAFAVGRKHAGKLKRLSVIIGCALPLLAILLAGQLQEGGWLAPLFSLLAFLGGTLGLLMQRWLFFAEAKHTVTLYYGAARA